MGEHFKKLLKDEHGVTFTENSENNPLQKNDFSKDTVLKDMRYLSIFKRYMNIGRTDIRKSIFPSGFCPPLVRRIFIGTDGKIMLCERIDEANPLFHLGDVFSGYDFDKIDELYKATYKALKGNCDRCWAFRFCSTCFAHLESIDYDGEYCKELRRTVEQDLMNFLDFKYNNRRFEEIMQSISVD
jgi:uncharacterized protein